MARPSRRVTLPPGSPPHPLSPRLWRASEASRVYFAALGSSGRRHVPDIGAEAAIWSYRCVYVTVLPDNSRPIPTGAAAARPCHYCGRPVNLEFLTICHPPGYRDERSSDDPWAWCRLGIAYGWTATPNYHVSPARLRLPAPFLRRCAAPPPTCIM